MKIHLIASEPHYFWHMGPIFDGLPDIVRGETRVGPRVDAYGLDPDDIIMVAGFIDIGKAQGRRVIYVEHGAGQVYVGLEGTPEASYYPGGPHPSEVIGYISPNLVTAERWAPTPAVSVGCPYLADVRRPKRGRDDVKRAIVSFHWDNPRFPVPEMRSAADHWMPGMAHVARHLREAGYAVYGTGHPKDPRAEGKFRHYRIPFIEHVSEVHLTCDLLLADNTSLMYEMAHLDVPVVALNAPWYRKNVTHGLRFWSAVPGYQVDSPRDFVEFDLEQVHDEHSKHLRDVAAYRAYGSDRPTGKEVAAAVSFVTDLLVDLGWRP